MMDDRLIRDLRVPKMNASSTMAEAADEIERLRSLISAWADASDLDNEMWKTDPSISDRAITFAAMRNATLELRQAVGR